MTGSVSEWMWRRQNVAAYEQKPCRVRSLAWLFFFFFFFSSSIVLFCLFLSFFLQFVLTIEHLAHHRRDRSGRIYLRLVYRKCLSATPYGTRLATRISCLSFSRLFTIQLALHDAFADHENSVLNTDNKLNRLLRIF